MRQDTKVYLGGARAGKSTPPQSIGADFTRDEIVLLLECMELAQHHYAGEEDLDPGYNALHRRLTRELALRTAVD